MYNSFCKVILSKLTLLKRTNMKKLLPWLLLLLLLIVICVSTHKESINVNGTPHAVVASTESIKSDPKYIDYSIVQTDTSYVLKGNFKNTQQQEIFVKTVAEANSQLKLLNTTSNQTLLGNESIALTNTILPHFIANYKKGKIVYAEQKLKIYGDVKDYEAQHEMQRLLNTSKLASQDNSTVHVEKPITFSIIKENETMQLNGIFGHQDQISQLKAKLPQTTQLKTSLETQRVDKGIIAYTNAILPAFTAKYTQGKISYVQKKLSITGMVRSKADLVAMNQLISQTNKEIINHTSVDTEAIKRAELEATKAKELANAKAKLDADAKAKLDADAKAKIETEAKVEVAKTVAPAQVQTITKTDAHTGTQVQATAKVAVTTHTVVNAHTVVKENVDANIKVAAKADADANAKTQVAVNASTQTAHKVQVIKTTAENTAKSETKVSVEKANAKVNIQKLLQLENIEFEVAKGSLTTKGRKTVDKLGKILQQYASIRIEIAGHTDSDGSSAFNQRLSQARVDTVKKRLIQDRIAASRLIARGYGETKPLVPNTNDANKQKNRRVEINIQGE